MMLDSVVIEGYRGFSRLEMGGLGRVNLLVGRNNSGKTSALEALYLVSCRLATYGIWEVCRWRDELVPHFRLHPFGPVVDISHLFYGHSRRSGCQFQITGSNAQSQRNLVTTIVDADDRDIFVPDLHLQQNQRILLGGSTSLVTHSSDVPSRIRLSDDGGLSHFAAASRVRHGGPANVPVEPNVQFVPSIAVPTIDLVQIWERIQLTKWERWVVDAIRHVDPTICEIRLAGVGSPDAAEAGFVVRLEDMHEPIPLGSLGFGVRRLLGLAIVMSQCAGGMLLVDDVDTGLHHSVMTDLWRLVQKASADADIQVFATTHSQDCVHALSSVCDDDPTTTNRVSIQRIERGRTKAIPFSEDEIRIVAQQRMEIR